MTFFGPQPAPLQSEREDHGEKLKIRLRSEIDETISGLKDGSVITRRNKDEVTQDLETFYQLISTNIDEGTVRPIQLYLSEIDSIIHFPNALEQIRAAYNPTSDVPDAEIDTASKGTEGDIKHTLN